ncbi:UNVERIFIED_CONTAM: hypothetical protein FKN15_020175 [Acipenser sinensis]
MDQWLWYNFEPSRNRWDGGLEDFLGGLEEEGLCFACGEYGHLVACCPFQEEEHLLPAQKEKRRRGGHSRRRTRELGPSPVRKMELWYPITIKGRSYAIKGGAASPKVVVVLVAEGTQLEELQ